MILYPYKRSPEILLPPECNVSPLPVKIFHFHFQTYPQPLWTIGVGVSYNWISFAENVIKCRPNMSIKSVNKTLLKEWRPFLKSSNIWHYEYPKSKPSKNKSRHNNPIWFLYSTLLYPHLNTFYLSSNILKDIGLKGFSLLIYFYFLFSFSIWETKSFFKNN